MIRITLDEPRCKSCGSPHDVQDTWDGGDVSEDLCAECRAMIDDVVNAYMNGNAS